MRATNFDRSRIFTPRLLVLAALIGFAVLVRLLVHFNPGALPYNFTPVAAIALFGGAFFRHRLLAFAVPLGAMFLSDLAIGFSSASPMVYLCFAAMVLVGMGVLRGRHGALRVTLTAAGSATGFYLVTNFFVWLTSGMYALTASGLAACYVAGLPFYTYGSLPGTLLWSAVLFGGFALLSQRFSALRAAPAAA
jgi:hypothetical protein